MNHNLVTSGAAAIAAAIGLAAFTSSAIAAPDHPVRIMPLGDSITRGNGDPNINAYRKKLYEDLGKAGYDVDFVGTAQNGNFADIDHEGHSGWEAQEIRNKITLWLETNPADLILLHIGTNDISTSQSIAGIVAEVDETLDHIDAWEQDNCTSVPVVLARIINRADPLSSNGVKTSQYNDALQVMADARMGAGDNLTVVDMEAALEYPADLVDGLHPTVTGYEKMADVWNPIVTGIIDNLPDYDGALAINLQLTGDLTQNSGLNDVDCDDVMGVVPLMHWNPTHEEVQSGSQPRLTASNGRVYESTTVTWDFDRDGWSENINDAVPEPIDANHKLMQGVLWEREGSPTVTFNGLDDVFGPGALYDVILYMDGWESDTNGGANPHVQQIQFNAEAPITVTLNADYNAPNAVFDDATDDLHGNYFIYSNRSGDGFTITVSPAGTADHEEEAFLNGVQIVEVIPPPAVPGDANGDEMVNVFDLLTVLGEWGSCASPCPPVCAPDLNVDCQIDVLDLLEVLDNWS